MVTPVLKKILQTMKTEEKVSCRVKPGYLRDKDPQIIEKYGLDLERDLYIDVEMKYLMRVEDVYKDGTTLHKTLKKGDGTASPYADFQVICKYPHHTLKANSESEDFSRRQVGV